MPPQSPVPSDIVWFSDAEFIHYCIIAHYAVLSPILHGKIASPTARLTLNQFERGIYAYIMYIFLKSSFPKHNLKR